MIFSLRNSNLQWFKIKNGKKEYAIQICLPSDENLFEIGQDDIHVMKGRMRCGSSTDGPYTFDYNSISDVLGESDGFDVKRILVYQLESRRFK